MKKFPSYRQLDAMDCGPACLRIISKFYGKYLSLQFLREKCGVSKEGVSVYDLCTGAENIGLRSFATKVDFEKLEKSVSLPCIIHWDNSHFVVVYKIKKGRIYISDPAKGLVSYSKKEFCEKWLKNGKSLGVIIIFSPTPKFDGLESSRANWVQAYNYLIKYMKPYKRYAIHLLLVMLFITGIESLFPFISQAVIDIGIGSNDLNFIQLILIANVALVVFSAAGDWVRSSLNLHLASRIKISLLSDYVIKLMRLPISFFDTKLTGDILQRAKDQERIQAFIMSSVFSIFLAVLNLAVFGGILLFYDSSLFWIFLIGSLAYLIWVLMFWSIRKKLDMNYFELAAKDQSQWIENITHIYDIKLNQFEKEKRWKWEGLQAGLYQVGLRLLKVQQSENLGSKFINSLKNLALIYFSAKGVIDGEMTLGMMIAVQFIVGQLNSPLSQIIKFITSSQMAYISFLRLQDVQLHREEENDTNTNNMTFPDDRTIVLDNVYFKYNVNDYYVLKALNLEIKEGEVTAIVGASGSGKSTLIKMLLRLYPNTSGNLWMGGVNMNNVSLSMWRAKCGAVLQESDIFNDTILNNIVLNIDSIDYNRVSKVVEIANIKKDIEYLPLGYNTIIGQNGRGLSSGQKQRILIARALYKQPDFLFLDEATNALDSFNENAVTHNLNEAYHGKTVVIAAHRLSTVINADQIVVLEKGKIVEVGTHADLIAKEGHYFDLFKTQLGKNNHLNGKPEKELVL